MKNITTAIAITLLLSGCATPGKFVGKSRPNDCNGTGHTDIVIKYGDAYIEVTSKSEVARKGEIIFKLMPERNAASGVNYADVEVEITGKDADSSWLDKQAKYGKGTEKQNKCVVEAQAFGDYNFLVHVPGVGTIDPRLVIIDRNQH